MARRPKARRRRAGGAAATALATGLTALREGRVREAYALLQRAVLAHPDDADLRHAFAIACHETGAVEQALALLEALVRQRPRDASVWNTFGSVLRTLGESERSAEAYRRALRLDGGHVEALFNLGVLLQQRGAPREALALLERACARAPGHEPARLARIDCLLAIPEPEAALAEAEAALEAGVSPAFVHLQRGKALQQLGRLSGAIDAYRMAHRLEPTHVAIAGGLASALADRAEPEAAVEVLQALVAAQPASPEAASNLLLFLHYPWGVPRDAIAEAHRAWGARHGRPATPAALPALPAPEPGRRLRIGFLSRDLRTHSVGYFIEPVLAAHDRSRVHVTCYHDAPTSDATTERMRPLADAWHETAALGDEALVARIRRDRIDVLIELAGHTANHRLRALALRAAPVQVSWLGYPDTTGVPAMDFRITDAIADPPGETEHLHSERLWRLPDGFLCYRPPAAARDVGPPPCAARGHITFGSFNSLRKVNDRLIALWARVLSSVPGSTLLLKGGALADAESRAHLARRFAAHGIAAERLDLRPFAGTTGEHLAQYREVDIALDTHPYNGTTTTCEALWMGVPVVTLAGDRHCARVGLSLLARLGLEDLVAHDAGRYCAIATALAADTARLTALRATLRERMAASPLLDGRRLARHLEDAFEAMWQARLEEATGQDAAGP